MSNEKERLKRLRETLSYSFSDEDIRLYLGENARVIEYKDLYNYNSITDLLPEDRSYVIILVETKVRTGHYTALCRLGSNNNHFTLLYFDPYGVGVDGEFKYINSFWKKELRENEKRLTNLIKNSGAELFYNDKDLQSHYSFVSTCGRWCVLWIMQFLKGMDLKQFLDYIDYIVEVNNFDKYKKLKYDMVVIKLIAHMPNYN